VISTTHETAPPVTDHELDEAGASTALESPPPKLQRRGDVSKCPICGSAVDAEAFHCAQCHNYFCFHCRARLLKSDTQLSCGNQKCDYYAKLVCSACDPPNLKEEPPSVFVEPLDGYWPVWLIVSLIAFGVTWYNTSFYPAAAVAIALFLIGGYLVHRAGINIFGGERRVTHDVTSTHYQCICCQQSAREVPGVP
jgi:hypothetical protein